MNLLFSEKKNSFLHNSSKQRRKKRVLLPNLNFSAFQKYTKQIRCSHVIPSLFFLNTVNTDGNESWPPTVPCPPSSPHRYLTVPRGLQKKSQIFKFYQHVAQYENLKLGFWNFIIFKPMSQMNDMHLFFREWSGEKLGKNHITNCAIH